MRTFKIPITNIRKLTSFTVTFLFGLMAIQLSYAAPPTELKTFETRAGFAGLDAKLYPLGWNKNGDRLAVLMAHPNEAADDRLWTLQVLDLVNDKAVLNEEIRHIDKGGLAAFWTVHGTRITALLKPHGIKSATTQLKKFPALLGKMRNYSYEVKLDSTYGKEPNFGYRGLTNLQVSLIDETGKSKVVLDKKWLEWYPMASGVIGYLVNPQGDRIAILIGMTKRGYESAPHIRHIKLVGARVGDKF